MDVSDINRMGVELAPVVDSLLSVVKLGGVGTDSRDVGRGSLFFALRGESFDGNRYAVAALEAGAAMAVVDDESLRGVDSRLVVVEDSLLALQALAAEHRRRLGLPIVAITGSNGKTTTKELTREALSAKFHNVGYTHGNLNNHIGVPLTLLRFDESTQIGIVEMGASHLGEIGLLCEIARPDVGLITNVGRAHLEGFGGEQGVRQGKGEMYDFLCKNGGVAIYNSRDAILSGMVGERRALEARAYDGVEGFCSTLSMFGSYNRLNAAAAAAIAQHFGVETSMAVGAISAYRPNNNRSQIVELTQRANRLVVDCYNANPSSMEAAIGEFIAQSGENKVLIIGQMGELGQYSHSEHCRLMEMCRGVERSYFVGAIFGELDMGGQRIFADVESLAAFVAQNEIRNSVVLIKGSRANRLEQIIPLL